MIRVRLPAHLRAIAGVGAEVTLDVPPPVTQRTILDALEEVYPTLRGTIRNHVTKERRAFLRFFACQEDLSHQSPDQPVPDEVAAGKEPFLIIGAIAGGRDATSDYAAVNGLKLHSDILASPLLAGAVMSFLDGES